MINVPQVIVGSIKPWVRLAADAINELAAQVPSTIFTWNKGCITVPTSTTISGAEQLQFQSQFTGNGTLVITVFDAEGGVNVALNGVELGALTGAASQEVLYEVPVTNLVEGDNPLNVFKIWSTTADTAELRKLEVFRNFTREQISDSSIWGNITGTGKPEDDATVGATAGTDLKDSGAVVLEDADVKNDEQTFDDVSGASKPEDNATQNTGALADLNTVSATEIDTDAVTTDKIIADAVTITDNDLDITLTPTSATFVTILTLTLGAGTSDNVEIVISTENAFFTVGDAGVSFRVLRNEGSDVTVFDRVWTNGGNGAGALMKAYIFMDTGATGGGTITYKLQYKLNGTGDGINDRVRQIYFRARQVKR